MPKYLCLSVLILSVVTSKFILAQTPDTVFLEELTWTEVASAIDNGSTTILFLQQVLNRMVRIWC